MTREGGPDRERRRIHIYLDAGDLTKLASAVARHRPRTSISAMIEMLVHEWLERSLE